MDGEALTKSGIMLGLGETWDEILQVMDDLRAHDVDIMTMGQYLQPSRFHLPIQRYYTPDEFAPPQGRGRGAGLQVDGERAAGAQLLPRRRPGAPQPRAHCNSATQNSRRKGREDAQRKAQRTNTSEDGRQQR